MKHLAKTAFVAAIVGLVAGCTIKQIIEPASLTKSSELCIIDNISVRGEFGRELRAVLVEKNVPTKDLTPTADITSCEWTVVYFAEWSWDLKTFMKNAHIKIYHNGNLDGEASYDTGGGGNLAKFKSTRTIIRTLLDQLLLF